MMVLTTPLLGRGGVMARTSRGPQSCWHDSGSSRSFNREQDHVIAGASRHELGLPNQITVEHGISEVRAAI